MGPSPDVEVVRSALEEALPAPVASALLFDALDRWGPGSPRTRREVADLVDGPLAQVLSSHAGPERAQTLLCEIRARIGPVESELPPGAPELEVEIDLDVAEEPEEDDDSTMLIEAVPHSVSVLIVGGSDAFGERLTAAIGESRIYTRTVGDEAAFRHATFSASPLIVVVDAATPPEVRPVEMAAAVRRLPDAMLTVIWADDTDYGRETRVRIEQQGASGAVFLDRREGIEPLLDLVLSRYRRGSTMPPPA